MTLQTTGHHGRRLRLSLLSAVLCLGTAVSPVGAHAASTAHNPFGSVSRPTPVPGGANVTGWATDPDTTAPIKVTFYVDGTSVRTVTANVVRPDVALVYPKYGAVHGFSTALPMPAGHHTVCAHGVNVSTGADTAIGRCQSVTLTGNPYGYLDSVTRVSGSSDLRVTGWAIDPDTIKAITVQVKVSAHAATSHLANAPRADVAKVFPGTGAAHGYSVRVAASAVMHQVCVTAVNVAGGTGNTAMPCKIVNSAHPKRPSAPRAVRATAGFGGALVTWTAPGSNGGAPWTSYTVASSPAGASRVVSATSTKLSLTGLRAKTRYTFTVAATNVAGTSAAGRSAAVTT